MKTLTRLFGIVLLLFALIQPAQAITLDEAKDQGLIGEQQDGYLGLVVSDADAEVRALMQDVNAQRRQRYQQIAQQNGITLEQVEDLAYQEAVEATEAGHYVQLPNGRWVRKD